MNNEQLRNDDAGLAAPAASAAGRVVRVLLADDHPLVRRSLAAVLGAAPHVEVVGEAATGRRAVESVRRLHPDVVIMDVHMPDLDGLEATREIHRRWPRVRIIGLSIHEAADMEAAMRRAGATAYWDKTQALDDLIASLRPGRAPAPPEPPELAQVPQPAARHGRGRHALAARGGDRR